MKLHIASARVFAAAGACAGCAWRWVGVARFKQQFR